MSKARRQQRQTLRRARKSNKTKVRSERKGSKFNAKNVRKSAKLSKKQAHKLTKIYGDMSPEEVNEINSVQPYAGAMRSELEENDVPVNDPDDTIEIASKYAVMNEDIDEPIEADDVENAYSENKDPNVSDFEHAEKREGSRSMIKAGLTGVTAALGSYFGQLKQKQVDGEALTSKEKSLLNAKQDIMQQSVKNNVLDLETITPLLILAILAYLIFKK